VVNKIYELQDQVPQVAPGCSRFSKGNSAGIIGRSPGTRLCIPRFDGKQQTLTLDWPGSTLAQQWRGVQ
jgi:hypothetical protein